MKNKFPHRIGENGNEGNPSADDDAISEYGDESDDLPDWKGQAQQKGGRQRSVSDGDTEQDEPKRGVVKVS